MSYGIESRITVFIINIYRGFWSRAHYKKFMQDLLLLQFTDMKRHGTKIVLYNLWEDDEGQLELDFDQDPYVSTSVTCS